MGNLDADNLNNMYILFDYLKTQFEYVITISHIESMRDMVDSVIEITKSGEKSLISYT
jgi:DNA repair exonuclease SbcCD ATPase subunit